MEKKAPKVYKVKDPEPSEAFKDLHPHLPSPPSLLLIIGSVKQGKTNLLVNLTCSPEMYKDRFDETYIISNTLNADPKGKILKKYFNCEDHYDDSMIESIIEKQKSYDETTRPNIAIFLDDILTKDFKKTNNVSFLSTRFRHHGISLLCFTTQSFRAVSNLIRGNATDVIIMKQQSAKELEKIIEEYGQFYGEQKFRDAYDEVMKEKYNFLYLKLSENPAQLFKNFEERLI
tara:strand:+ start:441 stop:1133 length:693 start_codon:yes stop_codon:yes gene_type:complete